LGKRKRGLLINPLSKRGRGAYCWRKKENAKDAPGGGSSEVETKREREGPFLKGAEGGESYPRRKGGKRFGGGEKILCLWRNPRKSAHR